MPPYNNSCLAMEIYHIDGKHQVAFDALESMRNVPFHPPEHWMQNGCSWIPLQWSLHCNQLPGHHLNFFIERGQTCVSSSILNTILFNKGENYIPFLKVADDPLFESWFKCNTDLDCKLSNLNLVGFSKVGKCLPCSRAILQYATDELMGRHRFRTDRQILQSLDTHCLKEMGCRITQKSIGQTS